MRNSLVVLSLLFLSSNAFSATGSDLSRPFSIGVGTYASIIAYDESTLKDDEFSGLALSFTYAFSDQFAARATLFSLEHDDISNLDSKGYDILGYFGTGLATLGFKAYVGGGIFRDKWESGSYSKTFNGLQLSGGIGYNWDVVSLDFVLGLRGANDYEDAINNTPFYSDVSAAAVSSSLLLSVRF